jgi:hypothetical protein
VAPRARTAQPRRLRGSVSGGTGQPRAAGCRSADCCPLGAAAVGSGTEAEEKRSRKSWCLGLWLRQALLQHIVITLPPLAQPDQRKIRASAGFDWAAGQGRLTPQASQGSLWVHLSWGLVAASASLKAFHAFAWPFRVGEGSVPRFPFPDRSHPTIRLPKVGCHTIFFSPQNGLLMFVCSVSGGKRRRRQRVIRVGQTDTTTVYHMILPMGASVILRVATEPLRHALQLHGHAQSQR